MHDQACNQAPTNEETPDHEVERDFIAEYFSSNDWPAQFAQGILKEASERVGVAAVGSVLEV